MEDNFCDAIEQRIISQFQWTPPNETKNLTPGERKLCAAILTRSISDLFNQNSKIKLSAKKWVYSDDTDFPGFLSCCLVLDICPDHLRSHLKGMKKPSYIRGDVIDFLD